MADTAETIEYLGPPENFDDDVAEAAVRYGVDPELAIAVHRQEYNPKQWVSSAGARGPMQLMPDTAKGMGVKNIDDPHQNIDGGVRYLKQMLDERKGNIPLALASYNAGPAKVGDGVPVFTYGYVKKVMERADNLRANPKIEYLGPGDEKSDSQSEPQASALPDRNRGMGTPAPSDPNRPRENDIDQFGEDLNPNRPTPVNTFKPFTPNLELPGYNGDRTQAIPDQQVVQPTPLDYMPDNVPPNQAIPVKPFRQPRDTDLLGGSNTAISQGTPGAVEKYLTGPAQTMTLSLGSAYARGTAGILDRLAEIAASVAGETDPVRRQQQITKATNDMMDKYPELNLPEQTQFDAYMMGIINKLGANAYDYFLKSAEQERQIADTWESKKQFNDPISSFVGETAGGVVPGIVQFVTDKYLAPIHGMATGGPKGALQEGGERAIMGAIFGGMHGYSRPVQAAGMGSAFAGQAAIHGAPADEIAKSGLTGAIFGGISPGGEMGVSDLARSVKSDITNLFGREKPPSDVDLLNQDRNKTDFENFLEPESRPDPTEYGGIGKPRKKSPQSGERPTIIFNDKGEIDEEKTLAANAALEAESSPEQPIGKASDETGHETAPESVLPPGKTAIPVGAEASQKTREEGMPALIRQAGGSDAITHNLNLLAWAERAGQPALITLADDLGYSSVDQMKKQLSALSLVLENSRFADQPYDQKMREIGAIIDDVKKIGKQGMKTLAEDYGFKTPEEMEAAWQEWADTNNIERAAPTKTQTDIPLEPMTSLDEKAHAVASSPLNVLPEPTQQSNSIEPEPKTSLNQWNPDPNNENRKIRTSVVKDSPVLGRGSTVVLWEAKNESVGSRDAFYLGKDGKAIDADDVNLLTRQNVDKIWIAPDEETATQVAKLIAESNQYPIRSEERAALRRRVSDIVTSVKPQETDLTTLGQKAHETSTSPSGQAGEGNQVGSSGNVKQPWEMTREEFDKEAAYQGINAATDENKPSYWFTDQPDEARTFAEGERGEGAPQKTEPRIDIAYKSDLGGEWNPSDRPSGSNHLYTGKEKNRPIRASIPIEKANDPHRHLVEQALSEGKPVPPEVLKDYPDLMGLQEKTAPLEDDVDSLYKKVTADRTETGRDESLQELFGKEDELQSYDDGAPFPDREAYARWKTANDVAADIDHAIRVQDDSELKGLLAHAKKAYTDNLRDAPEELPVSSAKPGRLGGGGEGTTGTVPGGRTSLSGKTGRVFTPKGKEIEVRYEIVDANDLVASHDLNGSINPDYPKELQPRDRGRSASKAQILSMANKINPELLGDSAKVSDGAPIVGPDGIVESGNGRTIALREAYRSGKADSYRKWLENNADKFGLSREEISSVENPVLVRTRLTDVDRAEFSREANQSDLASMSPSELAKSDAERISDDHMAVLNVPESGNILALANRPFVKRFLDMIGPQEAAQYYSKETGYTKQLANRIQNAIFAKAYGDERLLSLTAEESDPEIKNLISALNIAAPEFARAKSAIMGIEGLDVTSHIVEAAGIIRTARNSGVKLEEFLAQQNMFREYHPNSINVARFFDTNKRSAKKMGEALSTMASAMSREIDRSRNQELFKTEKPTSQSIIQGAINRVGGKDGEEAKGSQPGGDEGFPERGGDSGQRDRNGGTSPGNAGGTGEGGTGKGGPGEAEERIIEFHSGIPVENLIAGVKKISDATGLTEVFEAGKDDIAKALSPLSRSREAKETGSVLRENLSEQARKGDIAEAALRQGEKYFCKQPVKDNLEFIHQYETGQGHIDPKLQTVADTIRNLFQERIDAVRALGTGKLQSLIENYFPHIWEDPKAAAKFIADWYSRRPMEGKKSFLRQRAIPTVKEGMSWRVYDSDGYTGKFFDNKQDAQNCASTLQDGRIAEPLKPVTDNPITLVRLKLREMDKYVMAHKTLQELVDRGIAQLVPAEVRPPKDCKKLDDRIGTVFGKPTISIKEAFDKHIMDGLNSVADALGISKERRATLRGKIWGYQQTGGNPEVVTRFAGPESVIAHEIGHAIDDRWNVHKSLFGGDRPKSDFIIDRQIAKLERENGSREAIESLQRQKTINKELRDLADLRFQGEAASLNFQRYVRKGSEKAAVMVEAYIHAPDKFREVAPTVYKWFENLIDKNQSLRGLKEIEPSLVLGTGQTERRIAGMLIRGNYYLPEPAARVINNYLAPGLRDKSAIFRGLLTTGNILNQVQLGLSAFHAGFTTLDAMVSKFALGTMKVSHGNVISGAADMVHGSIPFLAGVTNALRGNEVLKEWFNPGTGTPEIQQIVKGLMAAGGRARMDDFYRTQIAKNMMQAFRESGSAFMQGDILKGLGKGAAGLARSPFALNEILAKPVMEWLVPRQKLGVFADLMKWEMERNPNMTHEELRNTAGKIWDSVDNRMGQLVYDNMFWNKTVKDLGMASVRSLGWNLGTWREVGGGVIDTAKATRKVLTFQKPQMTYRMSYIVALPMVVGMLGAMTNYLMSGQTPQDLKDCFAPRTGRLDPNGSPERVWLPSYMKDLYHISTEPGRVAMNKLHPLFNTIAEMLTNKDYYGTQIRNEDDPKVQQALDVLKYIGKSFEPFAIRNIRRELDLTGGKAEPTALALPFIGITPAPMSVNQSPAERLLSQIQHEKIPVGARTKEEAERSSSLKSISRSVKIGDMETAAAGLSDMTGKGLLKTSDLKNISNRAAESPLLHGFKNLRDIEDAVRVWSKADNDERALLLPEMSKKLGGLKNTYPEKYIRVVESLTKSFR